MLHLHPHKKKESEQSHDDNVIRIEMPKTVLLYIINTFGKPTETITHMKHFKESYIYEIETEDTTYSVTFSIIKVAKYTYLDVSLSMETIEQVIQSLEDIHNKISASKIENDFIMILSYDSISEYYCNKAYPKLNELERNLRRLLLNTYTINFGTEYYETTINKELQDKIKGIIKANGNQEKKKIEQLKKFFYSMEFGDI